MNLYDVIKKPVITEKSMALLEEEENTLFKLILAYHKLLIKQAVEAAFEGVKVANEDCNCKTKTKTCWTLHWFYKQN